MTNLTKREMIWLLLLAGVTATLVLFVTQREPAAQRPQAPASPKNATTGALVDVSPEGDAAVLAATNPADGTDQTVAGAGRRWAVDSAEFAERVRRIRPPPAVARTTKAARAPTPPKAPQADAVPQDVNDIVRTLNQIAGEPPSPENDRLFQNTLVKWSNQDPAAALEYALTIESRRTRLSMLSSLIGNWARTDVNAAHAWALANLQDDAGVLESALRPIFSALAGLDRADAMRKVLELPAGSGRTAALRAVVERAVRDGFPNEMKAYMASITDPQEARLFASSLAQNWSTQDPLAAASWSMSLSDPLAREAALGNVIGNWTSDQPESAASWVMRLPAGALRNQQMSRLAQTWAGFDPVGAAEWLIDQQPPQASLDSAVQGFVNTVMQSNPEGAMGWAGAISDPKVRNAALLQVGRSWLRQNPQQATSYIASASLPPEVRASLLQGR